MNSTYFLLLAFGGIGTSLVLVLLAFGSIAPKPSALENYRNDPNYVKPVYNDSATTIALAEGQKTDGVQIVYLDKGENIVQFYKEERVKDSSNWSPYVLRTGESQDGCPTVSVLAIDETLVRMQISWRHCD